MKGYSKSEYVKAKNELIERCATGKIPALHQVETLKLLGGAYAQKDTDLIWLRIDVITKHYTKKMPFVKAVALFTETPQSNLSSPYASSSVSLYRSYLDSCKHADDRRKKARIACSVSACFLLAGGAVGVYFADQSGVLYGTQALSFQANGQDYVQEDVLKYNEYVHLNIPAKIGYDVKGIIDATTQEKLFDEEGKSLSVVKERDLSDFDDCVLQVVYEPRVYSAQVMGTGESAFTYTVESNPDDILDEPQALQGYSFEGWYTDTKFKNKFTGNFIDYTELTQPLILYPHYVLDGWMLTWQLNGGAFQSDIIDNYTILSDVHLPDGSKVVREGYTLEGWSLNGERIEYFSPTRMEDVALSAIWSPIKYHITYELNGGVIDGTTTTFTVEDEFLLEIPQKQGYTFEGWFENKSFTISCDRIEQGTVGNRMFFAKWEPIVYQINYDLNGGENSPFNPATYTAEKSVLLQTPYRKGYSFSGWYTKGGGKVTEIQALEHENVDLFALWDARTYTIQVLFDNGELAYEQSVLYDGYYSLPDPVKRGHSFVGFMRGGEEFASTGYFDFTSNITLVASCCPNEYTIIYVSGSEAVHSQRVTFGEPYQLHTPNLKENCEFGGWFDREIGGNRISDGIYQLDQNVVLYASWLRVITFHLQERTTYTVDRSIDKVYLVGDYNGRDYFLTGVNVKISSRSCDLRVELINVGFKASFDHSAIQAESDGFLLTVEAVGTCKIVGGDGVQVKGRSNDGKPAIEVPRLLLSASPRAKMFVLQGGDGGNGIRGQDGKKENTALVWCNYGHNGEDGGDGGNSGAAIRVITYTDYSKTELQYAQAGLGGEGGLAGYRKGWFAKKWGKNGQKGEDGKISDLICYVSNWV